MWDILAGKMVGVGHTVCIGTILLPLGWLSHVQTSATPVIKPRLLHITTVVASITHVLRSRTLSSHGTLVSSKLSFPTFEWEHKPRVFGLLHCH